MLTIGTHMSIAGGIAKTAENVVKMEANTMQIFSRNPRGSNYKTYTSEEIGTIPSSMPNRRSSSFVEMKWFSVGL